MQAYVLSARPLILQTLTEDFKTRIEKRLEAICKENQRFERIVVSRDEALAMFQENKFKVRTRSRIPSLTKHTPQPPCLRLSKQTRCTHTYAWLP